MKTLLVIPARGGSKGIPRKNLAMCGGMSLIERACKTASQARLVDAVVVSSDDDEILRAAGSVGGINLLRRPELLATDDASSEDVLVDALAWARLRGWHPQIIVLMQCTSPLTIDEDIDRTVDMLESGFPVPGAPDQWSDDAGCAFTVTDSHSFVWNELGTDEQIYCSYPGPRQRRQDLPKRYLETGAVYAIRVDRFLRVRSRFCGRLLYSHVPRDRSIEVDAPLDLEVADFLLRRRRGVIAQHTKYGDGGPDDWIFPRPLPSMRSSLLLSMRALLADLRGNKAAP